MTEELLINISPSESRVAVLEDGILNEIFIERHSKLGSVGNIYLGTGTRTARHAGGVYRHWAIAHRVFARQ